MLTDKQICLQIESAFSPHRCVVELWDYDKQVRFRVFGPNDEQLATVESILSSVSDPAALESLLANVRHRIQENLER